MKNRRNYYRILHVQDDAPTAVIRSSYRAMMQRMKMHPDLGGDCANASLINEAFAVLRDRTARERYDKHLRPVRDQTGAAKRSPKSKKSTTGAGCNQKTDLALVRCGFCRVERKMGPIVSEDDECHRCSSPLYPANKKRVGQDAKRAVDRMDRSHCLSYFANGNTSQAFAGHTEDVSLHGMQFVTDHAPLVEAVLKISTPICQATARVVSCRPASGSSQRWQVGVEFLTLRFERSKGSFVSATA